MSEVNTQNEWHSISSKQFDIMSFEEFNTLVINTHFTMPEISDYRLIEEKEYFPKKILTTKKLIEKSVQSLKTGGLLFIYGYPQYLSEIGFWLNSLESFGSRFLFKYWIAIEFKPFNSSSSLPNSHLGLLMYLKTDSLEKPATFNLNTKTTRIPYQNCTACGNNVKDWGGKKHLLNPIGTAISDVWKDLTFGTNISSIIPDSCLKRIYDLRKSENSKMVVIYEEEEFLSIPSFESKANEITNTPINKDMIITADSLELMREYSTEYPEGVFDVAFADPPYNLSKKYNKYSDEMSSEDYVKWCNDWLNLMCDVLKPGGSLFILNIPKWAIYHANNLNKKMIFRNWIVWDALSTPSGKLLPSHYSLLYYTKPGKEPTINPEFTWDIDSREYCLRNSCIKKRKSENNDKKEKISDIWSDIHRIKHKKDRDEHPCQLPIKLLSRIINLASHQNDWIYDPFGGAGTTAIAAKICNRHYVISDIDPIYKDIAEKNLNNLFIQENGETLLKRASINMKGNIIPRKKIEIDYYNHSKNIGKPLSLDELADIDVELAEKIINYYPDFKYLKKITNRKLESEKMMETL